MNVKFSHSEAKSPPLPAEAPFSAPAGLNSVLPDGASLGGIDAMPSPFSATLGAIGVSPGLINILAPPKV